MVKNTKTLRDAVMVVNKAIKDELEEAVEDESVKAIVLPSGDAGRLLVPIMRGWLGP